ncbi:MAG: HEPN domain-containing protein [Candidatus Bathyarchaeota archaeon]|nr:HEPN domain-containing protein [Candidatus Bathyarchaeota archaeon]
MEDWLREAEEDLESARILLDGGQYHHVCFHAQQAAEKAVKAILRGLHKARTSRSILDLLREVSKDISISEDLLDYAKILDQYYIPPRYPNAFSEGTPSEYYTRRQAEEALRYAEEVVGFARRIVREGIGRSY